LNEKFKDQANKTDKQSKRKSRDSKYEGKDTKKGRYGEIF